MEWKNIFRGLAMGASDVIPGVSGGTIAMVLGIYQRLIAAINGLFSHRWKQHLSFLIPLIIGIGVAILSLARLMEYLLETYPHATYFFFLGLIIGLIPAMLRRVDYKKNFQGMHFVVLALFAIPVALTGVFQGDKNGAVMDITTSSDYIFIFLAGVIASAAMILPGVSGSFLLLIIGAYPTIIYAISHLHVPILMTVIAGVATGILGMSKLIHLLLKVFPISTYAAMIGLVCGSIFVVFPGFSPSMWLFVASFFAFIGGLCIANLLGRVE